MPVGLIVNTIVVIACKRRHQNENETTDQYEMIDQTPTRNVYVIPDNVSPSEGYTAEYHVTVRETSPLLK